MPAGGGVVLGRPPASHPSRGGERSRNFWECKIDCLPNTSDRIYLRIVSRQPQDLETLRLEPRLAALVVVGYDLVVAVAVQLNNEPRGEADEVDDVGTDGRLSSEPPPLQLSALQVRPHAPFGGGHLLAQLPGAIGFGRWHARTIPVLCLSRNPCC